ncbi:lipoprotein [Polaromonas sp. P1(28)-13]|nr:lipoprotein [Polaromonas sp. P2-4]UUZ77480.1 lipoprotein [Polaromonas sp. P1(28)-13]
MVSLHQILGRVRVLVFRHGLVAVVVGAAALAGCGQKGPLFLPVVPKVPPAPVAATLNSDAPPAVVAPAPPASAAR